MRQIVLDTETTGLSAQDGDRIIEIGCVELLNRKLTGNNRHFYLHPEDRAIHEERMQAYMAEAKKQNRYAAEHALERQVAICRVARA